MKAGDTDPRVRCSRKRAPCGHERREHAKGRCFGVVFIQGIAGDCKCCGFMEPPDPPRFVRVGEVVDE